MKKIVHILLSNHPSITPAVIRFYDQYFDHDLHSVILYSEDESKPCHVPDGCSIPLRKIVVNRRSVLSCIRYIKMLESYDLVVLHSMTINWRTQLLIMVFYPKLFQKIAWIGWGADLYSWEAYAGRSLFQKLRVRIYRRFCMRIKTFIAIFPPDIDVYAQNFSAQAKTFYAPYVAPRETEPVPQRWRPRAHNSSVPLCVLIGHRCTEQVGHLDCIRALRKFNSENIRVVIPLGQNENPDYVASVKETATQAFGEKASFVNRYLSEGELNHLARETDVAFFNSSRQIALGTLNLLFLAGSKVFMPAGSVMSRFFKSQGIPIQDIESLVSMDFKTFSQPVGMFPGYEYVTRLQDCSAWAKHWQGIYDELLLTER
ncbi:MAG: TDP-N-acetylfucosamine:lipid II N-acetylfucosaminyltransferase [Kiritimatiellia bacterium]|jgi:hypothetical protein